MENILVTGDRGYIGSVLVPLLIKKGYKVVGIDTNYFSNKLLTRKINYKKVRKDIRKISKKDLDKIDAVIHLAGLSNDPLGEIRPAITEEINFKASIRLAKMAKSAGVKRFLFSSSCSVYGIAKNGEVDEKSRTNPKTEYAKSKVRVEKELLKLSGDKFTVGILRNPTVFGISPNFRTDLVANNLLANAITQKEIKVLSDGTPWRPLIDVRDLSKAFLGFLRIDSRQINGKVINVGFNESNYQVKTIAEIISQILGYKIVYVKEHGKDTRSYKVNFDKFKSLFPEIKQEWTLDRSIKEMAKIIRSTKRWDSDKFVRLKVLKKLIETGRINKRFYWNE